MNLTSKQAHVLANLNRVVPCQSLLKTVSSRPRYQLDGIDCTPQIRSLIVQKLISVSANDQFKRRDPSEKKRDAQRIGERQPYSIASIAELKTFLS